MKLIKTRNEIERFKKTQETDKNNEQRQNEWEIIKHQDTGYCCYYEKTGTCKYAERYRYKLQETENQ